MPVLHNLKVEAINNSGTAQRVIYDGIELQGVTSVTTEYEPDSIPQAYITLNTISNINRDLVCKFHFEPEDIRECIKFLALQLQLDDDLRLAWQASIYSALKDLEKFDEDSEKHICDFDKAGYILDRLME